MKVTCLYKRGIKLIFIFLIIASTISCSYKRNIDAGNIVLPPYYTDNMVLQAGRKLYFYGKADANTTLGIRIESTVKYAKSDENGNWSVTFPKMKYQKPFTVYFEGVDEIIPLHNVRIGNVFLLIGDGFIEKAQNKQKVISKITQFNLKNTSIYTPVNDTATEKKLSYSWQTGFPEDVVQSNTKLLEVVVHSDSVKRHTTGYINLCNQFYFYGAYYDSVFKVDSTVLAKVQDIKYNDEYWNTLQMPVDFNEFNNEKEQIFWLRKKVYFQKEERGNSYTLQLGNVAGYISIFFNDTLLANITSRVEDLEIPISGELTESWLNILSFRIVNPDSLNMISSIPVLTSVEDTNQKITLRYGWKTSSRYEQLDNLFLTSLSKVENKFETIHFPIKSVIYISGYWEESMNIPSKLITDSIISSDKVFIQLNNLPFNYLPYKAGFDSLIIQKENAAKVKGFKIVDQDSVGQVFLPY